VIHSARIGAAMGWKMRESTICLILCLGVACSDCRTRGPTRDSATLGRDGPRICDRHFDLSVQRRDGETILHFRYPDLGGRIAHAHQIDIDRVGDSQTFCSLKIIDLHGYTIPGSWMLGTIPPNFRAEGCMETSFRSGDYEVVVWSERFDTWRRIHVEEDGRIEVRGWEDLSPEECEQGLKEPLGP